MPVCAHEAAKQVTVVCKNSIQHVVRKSVPHLRGQHKNNRGEYNGKLFIIFDVSSKIAAR